MGTKNPKAKGAAFEREICKTLSKWVSGGERDDIFWRSAMSGGRATLKGGSKSQSGDISAVDELGFLLTERILFELKHYKDADFCSFFKDTTSRLKKEIKKSVMQATSNGKHLCFIVKQNFCDPVVFVDMPLFFILCESSSGSNSLTRKGWNIVISDNRIPESIVAFPLKKMLKIDPVKFRLNLRRNGNRF